jgi:DNA mismatch repair protein MutL
MIIDQYRADLRIKYEQFLRQLSQRQGSSQRLLFPEVVQFSQSEVSVLAVIMPELSLTGFDLNDLGGGSYAVGGVPAALSGANPVALLRDIVTDAADTGTVDVEKLHAAMALSLARHAAIPQGQVLSNEEMENVVNQLFSCSNVNYTPDGNTILHILPQQDIEQMMH